MSRIMTQKADEERACQAGRQADRQVRQTNRQIAVMRTNVSKLLVTSKFGGDGKRGGSAFSI